MNCSLWGYTVHINYIKIKLFDSLIEYDIENLGLPSLIFLNMAGTSLKLD